MAKEQPSLERRAPIDPALNHQPTLMTTTLGKSLRSMTQPTTSLTSPLTAYTGANL